MKYLLTFALVAAIAAAVMAGDGPKSIDGRTVPMLTTWTPDGRTQQHKGAFIVQAGPGYVWFRADGAELYQSGPYIVTLKFAD